LWGICILNKMEEKNFRVSSTMVVKGEEEKKVDYIVIKIGGKTYSTNTTTFPNTDINLSKLQITDTKNIGKQENLWIKGQFTEEAGHKKLDAPTPFELNVYSQIPENNVKDFKKEEKQTTLLRDLEPA